MAQIYIIQCLNNIITTQPIVWYKVSTSTNGIIFTITLSKCNRCHSKQNVLYFLPHILKEKRKVHCENWKFFLKQKTTYSNMHVNLKTCFGVKSGVWTVFTYAWLLYWQRLSPQQHTLYVSQIYTWCWLCLPIFVAIHQKQRICNKQH